MKQIPLFLVVLFVFINLAGCERDKPTPVATFKPHLVEVVTAELKVIKRAFCCHRCGDGNLLDRFTTLNAYLVRHNYADRYRGK